MNSASASSDHHTVVVGVDGTPACSVTVRLAAAEAARRSARLLIVHAWPGNYRGRFRTRGVHHAEADGTRLLTFAAGYAATTDPGLVVDTELRPGAAGETLLDCSHTADLLVIGHRDNQVGRPDWGSTTRLLANRSSCPLLVHRGRFNARGPMVAGVSGRSGAPALGYAFTRAALSGADLVAVHVWRRPDPPTSHPVRIDSNDPGRREAAVILATAVIAWSWRLPQVKVEQLVVPDQDAQYTLERASRRGRLMVAGCGGRGELAELIQAPPSRPGGHHGLCPVLLVPPDWPVEMPLAPAAATRLTG